MATAKLVFGVIGVKPLKIQGMQSLTVLFPAYDSDIVALEIEYVHAQILQSTCISALGQYTKYVQTKPRKYFRPLAYPLPAKPQAHILYLLQHVSIVIPCRIEEQKVKVIYGSESESVVAVAPLS